MAKYLVKCYSYNDASDLDEILRWIMDGAKVTSVERQGKDIYISIERKNI